MSNPIIKAVGASGTITAVDLLPITPDDDNDLSTHARAIRCRSDGTSGTIRVTTYLNEVRNDYIAAGEQIDVYVKRVHATGTSATNLVGMV